jgi:hypothetical protein
LRTGLYRTATSVLMDRVARTWAYPPQVVRVPTRIDHDEGQGGRRQGRDHGSVVAPRGFEHNAHGLHGLEPDDKGGTIPVASFGTPSGHSWATGQYPGALWRHRYQQRPEGQTSSLLTGPTLQDAGSLALDNCAGSGRQERDAPCSAPVSGIQAIAVYRVRIRGTGDSPTSSRISKDTRL